MRDAVHAEWTKLRTVPSSGWLLIAIIALTVGVGALATSIVKCPGTCDADTTKLSLTGIMLGQAAVAGSRRRRRHCRVRHRHDPGQPGRRAAPVGAARRQGRQW